MIKIGVSGALGRMGKRVINLAKNEKDLEVVFGLEKKGHPEIGKIFEGVKIVENPEEIEKCDCLVEFSTPEATLEHLSYLVKFKRCAVIGTTGFSQEEIEKIKEASQNIGIVFSPNMSISVNLFFKLIKETAKILKGYKVYIEEAHHVHKKDAPSGTAKKIAEILNKYGFGIKIEDIKAIRKNEITGDHKVIFESNFDKLELFHSAKTRDIFAQGALLAARWIVEKEAGLYSMEDVLFLE
ncbi:MAG: 4-hydroxy-tetrahydrodipicolinate reductase [Candidatus Omnitrophica bacterium 4484_70.1]|nr:MAG: 4-hydroxy-tetrahydrodipicolinate reductase [Candidatus Omnitrophica bacterium 4484_70.1]